MMIVVLFVFVLIWDEFEVWFYEVEEMFWVICEGEIDVVVIKGGVIEQVFMLEGDGQFYCIFMEVMDIGVVVYDVEG